MLVAKTSNACRRRVLVPGRCPLTVFASVGCLIRPLGRVDSYQVCRIGPHDSKRLGPDVT